MSFIDTTSDDTVKQENVNSLWVEKYRPAQLSDYVGNDHLRQKIDQFLATKDIPHLLLYGPAGTGKTSLAKLIVKAIPSDVLYVNASAENSVENVRTKIQSFASSMGFHKLKIVILDEADFLSANAQAALRNLMETFSMTTRFILTCNFQERIIQPIISRTQPFQVIPPSRKDAAALLLKILTTEKIQFTKEGIVAIVQSHYPDLRAIINIAQRAVINGVLTLDKEAISDGDVKTKLVELLKISDRKQSLRDIRQLIADNSIRDFAGLYTFLFSKIDEFASNSYSQVVIDLADAQYRDSSVPDKEINFMACIVNILKSLK